jgi:hypothetical protein
MECREGARRGEGDHDNGSNASSPNDDYNGAEEEEAAIDIVKDKGEDFATGPTSSHQDNAATLMDSPPPLLMHSPLPLRGLPHQQDNRTAGTKNAATSATTAAKVGIVPTSLLLGFGWAAKRGGRL